MTVRPHCEQMCPRGKKSKIGMVERRFLAFHRRVSHVCSSIHQRLWLKKEVSTTRYSMLYNFKFYNNFKETIVPKMCCNILEVN